MGANTEPYLADGHSLALSYTFIHQFFTRQCREELTASEERA